MATYFLSRILAGLSVAAGECLISDDASSARLLSVRFFGETVGTTAGQVIINYDTGGTPSVLNSATPEKTNSRSPATSASYGSGFGLSTAGVWIRWSTADFSHNAWIPSPRYQPIAFNNETVAAGGAGISSSTDLCLGVSENGFPALRSIRRRTTRAGYFNRFGNELHQHQKTGSGAFSMLAPHFDNDIAWIDPSAWRNGMSQNEVWEMNLFGVFPPISRNQETFQAVNRASFF